MRFFLLPFWYPMKTKILTFTAFLSFIFVSQVYAQPEYESRYATDRQERAYYNNPTRYIESIDAVHSDAAISAPNPHVSVIGWDPYVPLRRFVNSIQEGITDQQALLKLLSAPNIMWRSYHTGKEMWIYQWMWSYADEQDPNKTVIYMNHPGKRVKKNKTPVSMIVTFNDKDIVESYSIRLLKIKKDAFDDK